MSALASLSTRLAAAYGAQPVVTAVVLGGSRGAGAADAGSDLDLYVYATAPLPPGAREAIARAGSAGGRVSVGNAFFEPGDEWIDAETGLVVDVMFREPVFVEAELDRLLVRGEARVGCSTCFWWNVLRSEPLFDRAGWYAAQQVRAREPYPEPLRRAVVAKNQPLLRSHLSSFAQQLERAVERGDAVAANHRAAALLASAFDVLFAVNRSPHPGEKQLVAWAEALCPIRPAGLPVLVANLLSAASAGRSCRAAVDALVDPIDGLLEAEGLLP